MGGLILKLHRSDERVLYYVIGRRHARLDAIVRMLTHLGDAATTMAIVGMLLLVPGLRQAGQAAGFALVASHAAVQLLKRGISRRRPTLPVGAASLVQAPDRFSFPSGHAAAALSVAAGLSLVLPPVAAVAGLGLGLLVGMSRCYLGVHYPGDVVAGWLLALAAFACSGVL